MEEKTLIGYKGFDRNLKCRGFQYEKGKTFVCDGKVIIRGNGFHFCENPLDVLRYYFLNRSCELNRFFEVEASGEIIKDYSESLCCASRIRLLRELTLRDMTERAVQGQPLEFVSSPIKSVSSANDDEIISTHRSSTVLATHGNWSSVFVAGNSSSVCNYGNNCSLFINSQSTEVYNEGRKCTIIIKGNDNYVLNTGSDSLIVALDANNSIRNKGEGCIVYFRDDYLTSFWGIPGTIHREL